MLLAGLVVLAASCEKEIEKESPADATTGKMITETISAQIDDATKATVDADAKFAWTVGDNIAVHVSNGNYVVTSGEGGASVAAASASFTVSYPGGTTRDAFAIFPSTIVETDAANYGQDDHTLDVTLPSTYTLAQVSGTATPCPMIAANVAGEGWVFRQLCGLLRLTVNGIPAGTSYLKLDFNGRKVSGDFAIASPVTPGTSTIASVPGTKGTDDFITITGITDVTPRPIIVNIPLPTGVAYADLVVSAWSGGNVALKAAVEHFTYEAANAKGKKFTSTLNKGVFSIGPTKYAVFAPANLVATITSVNLEGVPTAATWAFHEHEYDMVPRTVGSTRPFTEGTKVDNFSWVGEHSAFTGLKAWGFTLDTDNTLFGNTEVENLKHDWGENSISGYVPNLWRTPTSGSGSDGTSEWRYLFRWRWGSGAQVEGKTKGCTVCGVAGRIIVPDNYSGAALADSYDAAAWATMEAQGVVFLPAAGMYKPESGFADYPTNGAYASSTSVPSYPQQCYYVNFMSAVDADTPGGYTGARRCIGYSVRLIRQL